MKRLRFGLILLLFAALAILGYCIFMLIKLHKHCTEIETENEKLHVNDEQIIEPEKTEPEIEKPGEKEKGEGS